MQHAYLKNLAQIRAWYSNNMLYQAHNAAKKVLDAAKNPLTKTSELEKVIEHLQGHCEPESPLGVVAQNLLRQ
ncbi:hypothetical protein CL633_00165 [bacterium]|nr:hypothetical protein [bacterium]|tara:strand:- start:6753 stop:6971 length:219 start_codon:yes stop_codon:yes gene_type:complete